MLWPSKTLKIWNTSQHHVVSRKGVGQPGFAFALGRKTIEVIIFQILS